MIGTRIATASGKLSRNQGYCIDPLATIWIGEPLVIGRRSSIRKRREEERANMEASIRTLPRPRKMRRIIRHLVATSRALRGRAMRGALNMVDHLVHQELRDMRAVE